MKKLFSVFLTVTMITAALVGCSVESEVSNSEVLRVGMDLKFPPFSYIGDDGKPVGLEPLISEAFAEYLDVDVEIVNTDFSMLLPALDTGDVDILIADMSRTDERVEKADFSNPYRYSHTLALVNKEFAEENNVSDSMTEEEFFALDDANFVGLSGTKGVYYPQSHGVDVTEVTEIGTGLLEISNGMSDILIASDEVFGFNSADSENTIVYTGIKDVVGSCFVVKKGNSELLEKSNEFIETMYTDGGFYDNIKDEYDVIVGEFLQNSELGLDYIINP